MTPSLLLALSILLPARLNAEAPALGPGAPVEFREASKGQGFLDQAALEAATLSFPPSPDAGSETDRADLAELHAWQARRTPGECARAQSETSPSYENMFGRLSPFPLPLGGEEKVFMSAVAADAGAAAGILKKRYQRLRPFLRDSTLNPCITRPGGWSYPSGHATLGRLWALVLADLAPGNRGAILSRGDEAGLDRVIGGVHHPSDVAAGRMLADQLYAQLQAVPAFRAEMARLRRRIASGLSAQAR